MNAKMVVVHGKPYASVRAPPANGPTIPPIPRDACIYPVTMPYV